MFHYITSSASCCKLSDDLLTWHAVFTYKVIFVETFLELLNPRLESIVYVCEVIEVPLPHGHAVQPKQLPHGLGPDLASRHPRVVSFHNLNRHAVILHLNKLRLSIGGKKVQLREPQRGWWQPN